MEKEEPDKEQKQSGFSSISEISDDEEQEISDFSSLNKYFKKEDLDENCEPVNNVKTIIEDVSINESSFRLYESEREVEIRNVVDCESEFSDKTSLERKSFLKELEDESLDLDTCNKVNKDWGRK